jgi:heptosyltransferase-2
MKKILVLPLYGIGDVLMTTPAIKNLKEKTGAEITYLHMFETTRDILLNNPYIDKNLYFPFLRRSKFDGLRFLLGFRKKFDCSINFYPSNRRDYNLAAFIIGSPTRIGHRYSTRDLLELNFLKNRTIMEDDRLHNVEENLRLLDLLGLKDNLPYPMEIFLTEEEISFSDNWMRERKLECKILVGIHPGASRFKNHDKKRLSEGLFAELIDRLGTELGNGVFLIFGGPEEKLLRQKILSEVRNFKNVLSIDNVSVRQAASLMKKCRVFISNDSGPMHMAAASGVPTVAIFGPTNPAWVRPWGVGHRVVRTDICCGPCFRYSPKPLQCGSKTDYACLRDIKIEDLFGACMDLLKERPI